MTLDQGSLVDPALRTHQTDLLLHVKPANAPTLAVFILFEHKSYPDRWVALQMLRYVVAIWQRQHSRQPGTNRLEEIVPVLVYHGSGKWRQSLQIADLVHTDRTNTPHIPHFEPIRVNLADLAEDRYAEVREDVMTYAEELLKEGLEQGLEQGELRDKQQVLVRH